MSLTYIGVGLVLVYNLFLVFHVFSEATSTEMHEAYLIKKESEYILGLNGSWLTEHFFFFSSYRSGGTRMIFRPFFNIFCLLLVVTHDLLGTDSHSKIIFF